MQRKDATAQIMHHINYTYNAKNNRLQAIIATGINSSNYSYDAIGNLANDSGENVGVTWNAMNKVKTVVTPNSTLHFAYSPTGQRQIKKTGDKTEYYLHDATGNIMCVYELSGNYLTVKERTIYGSKRIGVYRQRIQLSAFTGFGQAVLLPGSGLVNVLHPSPIISPDGRQYLEGSNRLQVIGVVRTTLSVNTLAYKKGTIELKGLSPSIAARPTFLDGTKTAGLRDYELTDHLSNVMVVISDRKLSVDTNNDTITDYYAPQVVSYTDYYPFGFPIAERSGNLSGYRFGFNGQEADNEVYGAKTTYAFEYRMQDTRLGRFWSVDPLAGDYPWNSTYAFAENRVIDGMELEGLEIVLFTENQGVGHTFIAVFTEKGVTAYTYGRYMGSYIPFLGAYAPIGKGVLLKYEGENANVYIRAHFEKGPSAKAYLIPSVNNDKVKKYYEYLYNSGTDLPEFIEKDGKMEKNPYYKYGKFIDTYLLIGNSCVTKTNEALKEGGFNLTQEAMPTNPPLILVSPNEVQLLIDIIMRTDAKKENENPRVYDVTNDVKKW